jgi:hypothetical protein
VPEIFPSWNKQNKFKYLASQKDIDRVFSTGQATANYLKDNQTHALPNAFYC